MASNVTVTQIAEAAGVAQSTVSAALHGRGRVGQEVRDRIVRLAKQMGYQPRVAAQLLRSGRTGQVGIVVAAADGVSALSGEVQRLVLGHFVQTCIDQNLPFMIDFHHHEQDTQGKLTIPRHVAARLVDGTLLLGDVGGPLREWIRTFPMFPCVSIEEPAEYCVLSAADEGVRQAARMLYESGHRRFAYVAGPGRYSQQRLGSAGMKSAAQAFGISPAKQKSFGPPGIEECGKVAAWSRELISQPDRPTAFICHGEPYARSVMHAAVEKGLRVPQDLSIVSYGSSVNAALRYPPLTTIENDYGSMTGLAMTMLRRRIVGETIESPQLMVAPRLVVGATTGSVPADNL